MERIYNIPLRKEFQKAPRYKKSAKAIRAIKAFVSKHMKSEDIIIGKYLNDKIWENGPKNPPHKVSVKVVKKEDKVKVELVDAPEEKIQEKPEKKKGLKEKLQEKVTEPKKTKEDKKESEDEVVKEEIKEKPKEEKIPTARELKEKKTTS
tara:strand:- start:3557 stop:4006 length:450 start_codon:yes stop_codon:yes gene_type:complete